MIRIGIEGPHGVGKTSVVARLRDSLPYAAVLPETVLERLDDVYRQFGEGTFVLNDVLRDATCDASATYCLLDRCAASTYVYQTVEHGAAAGQTFLALADQLVRAGLLHPPTLILVMMANPSVLETRLRRDKRPVTRDYLDRHTEGYEHLILDTQAQSLLGRAVLLDVEDYATLDQTAAAAQALIERECPPAPATTNTYKGQ